MEEVVLMEKKKREFTGGGSYAERKRRQGETCYERKLEAERRRQRETVMEVR